LPFYRVYKKKPINVVVVGFRIKNMDSQIVSEVRSTEQIIQSVDVIPQPQQSDPRFEGITLTLFGRARELYLEAFEKYQDEVEDLWKRGWELYENPFDVRRHVELIFREAAERQKKKKISNAY
jgi:hypothetical protein